MLHMERDSQRCFVSQILLLFRRVLFTELESVPQIFTDVTLARLMCGQCVSQSIVVSQCLATFHRVCQKIISHSLAKNGLQCFISSIEFCFTEFAFCFMEKKVGFNSQSLLVHRVLFTELGVVSQM